jgi:hypothetical protein
VFPQFLEMIWDNCNQILKDRVFVYQPARESKQKVDFTNLNNDDVIFYYNSSFKWTISLTIPAFRIIYQHSST